MAYKYLSDILSSEMITELTINAEFTALTDDQKKQVMNSAQQVVCDLYVAKEKTDYKVNTTMQLP